jgi:hypothetical protein
VIEGWKARKDRGRRRRRGRHGSGGLGEEDGSDDHERIGARLNTAAYLGSPWIRVNI